MKRGSRDCQEVTQCCVFDPAICKIIHATNATACVNRVIRDSNRTKRACLAILNVEKGGRGTLQRVPKPETRMGLKASIAGQRVVGKPRRVGTSLLAGAFLDLPVKTGGLPIISSYLPDFKIRVS